MTDLRDRIREALHAPAGLCPDYHAADCQPCTDRADAVVTAHVQPELDRLRDQLRAANGLVRDANRAEINQRMRAEQAEELLRIAHDTSNTSERARARAVQRAETAERELAQLRAYHQQIGDLPQ